MKLVKIALVSALVMVSTTGCALVPKSLQTDPLVAGGPAIHDGVFLLQEQDPALCKTGTGGTCSLPAPCADADKWTVTTSDTDTDKTNQASINKCTAAMKQLIKIRGDQFEHNINATMANTNFVIDATTEGLNIAGTLTAAGTTKILSAIAAGLGGTKKSITDDLLYSYSMRQIVQQMETDRALKEQVIDARLAADTKNPYHNMYDAASDLYDYDRASTWDAALNSLVSSTAAKSEACQTQTHNQKMSAATTGAAAAVPPATPGTPCSPPEQPAPAK